MVIRYKCFCHVYSIEADFSGNCVNCRKELDTSIWYSYFTIWPSKKSKDQKKRLCYLGQIFLHAYIFIFPIFYATTRQDLMKKNRTMRQYQAVSFSTFFFDILHHYLRTTNYYQMDRNLFTVRRHQTKRISKRGVLKFYQVQIIILNF